MNTDEEIRDWYAGQALAGLLAGAGSSSQYPINTEVLVKRAFDYADFMMIERKKRLTV